MTNSSRLKTMLNPRDRGILSAEAGTNWVPEEPRELLLPYVEPDEEKEVDRTSIEFRRKKAKEVFDGYGKIAKESEALEKDIESQCKNVRVPMNPSLHLRVIESIKRVFPGHNGSEITFEMYKKCVQALAESSSKNIPNPFENGE